MKLTKKLILNLDEFKEEFGLGFDLALVQSNLEDLLRKMDGIKINFSVKSFPRKEFIRSIADDIHGWDIANLSEFRLVEDHLRPHHSIWITNAVTDFMEEIGRSRASVYLTLDKMLNFEKVPPEIHLGIRLDPYSLLNRGHSRFGFLVSDLKDLSLDKFYYLHTHLPGEFTSQDLEKMCKKLKELIPLFPKLQMLNMGGGLRADNLTVISALKKTFPNLEIVIEPGRYLSEGAGGAVTKIVSIFEKEGDLYLVGRISPVSHLNWARKMTFTLFPQGEGRTFTYKRLIYVSLNAFEDDQLILEDNSGEKSIEVGDYLILANVSGYSVAWNRSFNGVSEAPVMYF